MFIVREEKEYSTNKVYSWKSVLNLIIFGIIFTSLNLNFFGLNYFIPLCGSFLILLGFRALRKENNWFRSCYIITLVRFTYFISVLILNATIYHEVVFNTKIFIALTIINQLLFLSLFFCYWRGVKNILYKVNLPTNAVGEGALVIWYAIFSVLIFLNYNGLSIMLIMSIAYIVILYRLFKATKEIDQTGYKINVSWIRIPNWGVVTIGFVILGVGITIGYLFYNDYSMDWREVQVTSDTNVEKIKESLIALGFPKDLLADLTNDDIKACYGATRVVADENNNGTVCCGVCNGDNLSIISVGVEFPSGVQFPKGEKTWKIFHYFRWKRSTDFYGTDSIKLTTAGSVSGDWHTNDDISGRILYDLNGKVYTSPYYFLGDKQYVPIEQVNRGVGFVDVFATFSMPKKGENHRGYLTYSVMNTRKDQSSLSSWINYTHQNSWAEYPAMTAMQEQIEGGAWEHIFFTKQDALQITNQGQLLQ